MFTEIENVKPGQTFTLLGVEYRLLRHAGDTKMLNRNQWGRATGGEHNARRLAVKVNRGHKGWRFSYLGVPFNTRVKVDQ